MSEAQLREMERKTEERQEETVHHLQEIADRKEELENLYAELGSLNVVGQVVHHKRFGEGIVSMLQGHTLEIKFLGGEKKLLFPDCFDFLSFENAATQEQARVYLEKLTSIQRKERELKILQI